MCDWSACLTGQPGTLQCLHDGCTSSVGSQTVSNPWALTTGAAAETRPYRARQGALPALLRQVQAFAADAKRCRGSAGEKRRPLAGGEDSQETLRGDVALYMDEPLVGAEIESREKVSKGHGRVEARTGRDALLRDEREAVGGWGGRCARTGRSTTRTLRDRPSRGAGRDHEQARRASAMRCATAKGVTHANSRSCGGWP